LDETNSDAGSGIPRLTEAEQKQDEEHQREQPVKQRVERVQFDYQNLFAYHSASADAIELRVAVPFSDGVAAEARITLSRPVRVMKSEGSVEYKMDMNSTLSANPSKKEQESPDGGSVETQSRDGLEWEIPEGYPGAWTALLDHEPIVREFLLSQFAPDRVFVDVGANVGAYSLRAAAKGMQVVSFEPNPENVALLRKNAELNRLSLDLHECALGSSEGRVRLSQTGGTSKVTENEGIEVPLATLDSFNLPWVDLMKIDVEGYEFDVVEGARKTLERCHPNIMVEMHHWLGAEKEASMFRIFGELGYRFEYLDRYALGRHLAVIAPMR